MSSQKAAKGHTVSSLWRLPASPHVDSPLPLLEDDVTKGESHKPTWVLLPPALCY